MTGSGIEWVGDVPSHWVRQPLFALVAERNESNGGMIENNLLSLSYGRIIRKDIDNNDGLLPASFETYQIVEPNDIVWRLTDLQNDQRSLRTGIVRERGIITSAYLATQPRRIAPDYLGYLLRAYDLTKVFYSMGGGLRQSMKFADVKWLPVMLPPADEQVAIAGFLDRETAKIDALVEEQRRLIALLREKRQAVISHAVTKGLDPHAPMKGSGIEWLGDMPAHWERAQLGRLCRQVSDGPHFSPNYVDEGIMFLSARNIRVDRWCLEDAKYVSEEDFRDFNRRVVPEVGDILYTKGGTTGVARVVDITEPFQVWVHVAVLKIDGTIADPDFVSYALNSTGCYEQSQLHTRGATNKDLGLTRMIKIWLSLPPVSEQREICAALAGRLTCIDALISQADEAIALLNERRAALISAAVTGKIDVRGLAKVLPFPIDRARARGLVGTEIIERSAGHPTFGRVKFQKVAFLAEGHVGISELAGCYTRAAAGPLDGALIDEMENGANGIAGIERDQPGGSGTTNSYRLTRPRGAHRQELADWLGADRTAKLDKLIGDFAGLTTKQAEAVATLYSVWNDALSEGASPTNEEIITGFLNDWHPEKRQKFRASELPEWLGWMRRHGIVPTGTAPKTTTGRLFV
jgi:restriction endonuclease S subunit